MIEVFRNFFKKEPNVIDHDYNPRASRIKDIFCGYPYIYRCTSDYLYILYDYGPGGARYNYDDAIDWCKENLTDKFHAACIRSIKDFDGEWVENGIGGADYLFFGFKNERDYMWFKLKWE